MDKKHIKIILLIFSFIIFSVLLVVIADYFSLFGTSKKLKLDFIEVKIKTIDAESGNLILNVGVRCFQKNNRNACTRRDSHRAGVVSAHVPVRRVIEESLFFKQSDTFIQSSDPKLQMMFIHNDYYNLTETMLLDDLYSQNVTQSVIEMSPINQANQEGE